MTDPTTVAIVLAAGKGVRVGGDLPKQLLPLGDRPVLVHALDQHRRLGHQLIIVVSDASRPVVDEWVAGASSASGSTDGHPPTVVPGGATRRASVLAGIDAVSEDTDASTAVLLRNAASPNTPDEVVIACAAGVANAEGMQAYVASEATTFEHADGRLERVIPRSSTGFTCDPTAYRRALLSRIADELRASDDGETTLDIARRLGATIGLVESPADNIKITTPGDLERVRVAMGYADAGSPDRG